MSMAFYIHKADNGIALISLQCQIQIEVIVVAPKQFISTHTQYAVILEGKKRRRKKKKSCQCILHTKLQNVFQELCQL